MQLGKEQRVDMQKEIVDTAIVVNPTFFLIFFKLVIFLMLFTYFSESDAWSV